MNKAELGGWKEESPGNLDRGDNQDDGRDLNLSQILRLYKGF